MSTWVTKESKIWIFGISTFSKKLSHFAIKYKKCYVGIKHSNCMLQVSWLASANQSFSCALLKFIKNIRCTFCWLRKRSGRPVHSFEYRAPCFGLIVKILLPMSCKIKILCFGELWTSFNRLFVSNSKITNSFTLNLC